MPPSRCVVAKQMTPAELRAAARKVHVSEPFYAEACLRLADVIEYAESVMRERSDTIARGMRVGTAETFLGIARGEDTP